MLYDTNPDDYYTKRDLFDLFWSILTGTFDDD